MPARPVSCVGERNEEYVQSARAKREDLRDARLGRGASVWCVWCGRTFASLLRWSCVSNVCVSACLGVVRVAAQKLDKYITSK